MIENKYSHCFEKNTCKSFGYRKLEIDKMKIEKKNRSFDIRFKPKSNTSIKVEVDDSWFAYFSLLTNKTTLKTRNDFREYAQFCFKICGDSEALGDSK